ncbi:MAG: DUF6128 domain-containing protein [Faecalimonas sp.]|nr:DUF6128 domain-containing protein [Faecalimonas sp.]
MEQSIQYLYEYENGKAIRNLGFMKVDKQMDKSVISLFATQVDHVKGILFEREDGTKYMATWEPCEEEVPCKPEPEEKPEYKPEDEPTEEPEDEPELYIRPATMRCEKIKRQDLSRLPRQEWRLANNNFLLHGFYNYHHLLYIEEENKAWIGVPGIFHEKEQAAAKAFGFAEFRRLHDVEVELLPEEQNTYDDFGYWCRQVAHSQV